MIPKDISARGQSARSSLIAAAGAALALSLVRVQRDRRRAASLLKGPNAVSWIFAESPTLAEAAPRVLGALGEALDWELGVIWQLDAEGRLLECVGTWDRSGVNLPGFERVCRHTTFALGEGLPGRVWASGEPAWIPDVQSDVNFTRREAAAAAGLRTAFGFPIRSETGVLGTMEFFSHRVRRPDEDLLQLMATVGDQLGQYIERRRAEEAVSGSEAYKTAVLESALDCVITMDAEGRVVEFNPAAEAAFGYSRAEAVGQELAALVIPAHLRDRHREGLARYLATGEGPLLGRRVEVEAMRRDGTLFPVELAITPFEVAGRPIFTGFIRDITAARELERDRLRSLEAERDVRVEAQRAERRAERFAERTISLQKLTAALSEALTYAEVGEVVVGEGIAVMRAEAGSMIRLLEDGKTLEVVRAEGYPEILESWKRFSIDAPVPLAEAVRTGKPVFLESHEEFVGHYPVLAGAATSDGAWAAVPLMHERRAVGAIGLTFDESREFEAEEIDFILTVARQCAAAVERARLYAAEKSARAAAEAARRRAVFLAEAGALLDSSLDYAVTLQRVATIAVPEVADWCGVDLVGERGTLDRLAAAHVDPSKTQLAEDLARRYPPDPDSSEGVMKVIRTGRSTLLSEIPPALLEAVAQDAEHLEILRGLGLHSAMLVPLRLRGRTFGAITFVSAESSRRFGDEDLALAEELARRAATAIDNARLYSERAHVARTLQRSLLPPALPRVPRVELAVRYRAAGEGNEVGGDFYDVFRAGDDWIVAVGDVSGKGAEAAAVTGLVRQTLRAATQYESTPSRVLGALNAAILRERSSEEFCSVAVARLQSGDAGTRMVVSSGGHPLPLCVRSDGRVEQVGVHGTLLGVLPDPDLHDQEVEFAPGDTLVLYTDGVTEARTSEGMLGEDALVSMLERSANLPAAAIASEVERAAVSVQEGRPRDDIAILVLRVLDADETDGRALGVMAVGDADRSGVAPARDAAVA
jgi:PAS domain S-box-containing protein